MDETYEYAGFIYRVTIFDNNNFVLTAIEGQHPAAKKERHIKNAAISFEAENKGFKYKPEVV